MPLPRKPERSVPIPNQPFESPEIATMRGPYWDMPLGTGLESDPYGSVQTSGSTPSEPSAYLYGSNGFIGVGAGLQIGPNGELEQGDGYIYCTPQYNNLPVTYPPYGCETEVNTTGVTSFKNAWSNCLSIEEFPCVDSSSVTNFRNAWLHCDNLYSFPLINTSKGEDFTYSWAYTDLTTFPNLNTSSGLHFTSAWCGCYYLTEQPKLDFSNAENFTFAWYYAGYDDNIYFPPGVFKSCSKNGLNFSRAWEGCETTQESVDNIIISLNDSGTESGFLDLSTLPNPSQSVIDNVFPSLEEKGWCISWPGMSGPSYGCSTAVDPTGEISLFEAWKDCTSLTSFPLLNVSSCRMFSEAWSGCSGLTSFPALDTSAGVAFEKTWNNCSSLTEFPLIDISSGVFFEQTWLGCSNLETFPLLEFDRGTFFLGTWQNCTSLTSFPPIDLSKGTTFAGAWQNCTSLTSFPALDLSSGSFFPSAWSGCTSLTSFPVVNVSSGIGFSQAWYGCESLTSFPSLDFSSGTDFGFTWYNCTSLTSFPAGVFDDCLANYFIFAWQNCALDQTSVDNILVSLDTAGQSNGIVHISGGTSAPPSATGLAAKAALESRGWTVLTN